MKPTVAAITAISVLVLVATLALLLRHRSRTGSNHVAGSVVSQPATQQELASGPLPPERQRSFAALACGHPLQEGKGGTFGCPVCPRSSDFSDESLAPGYAGKDPAWTYGSMIFGHFTSPVYDEALLRIEGCESHADGFGGDFLLRREGTNWTPIRYISGGLAGEQCQRTRWTGGRDALVCEVGDMHQGIAEDSVLLLTIEPSEPADRPDGQDSSFLYATTDEGDCDPSQGVRTLQSESVDKVNLLPADPNGRQDVEILASAGTMRARVTGDGCPQPPRKPFRLLFHNAGDHFVAGPGVAAWRALDPGNPNAGETVKPMQF